MSRQRRRDTAPELALRRHLHARGLRYRVTWPIPGLPRRTVDIAFTRARLAVFVDGCFWHGCPEHATYPSANGAWWAAKLAMNQQRDRTTTEHLESAGWTVVRVWEHENPDHIASRISDLVRTKLSVSVPTVHSNTRSTAPP
ncbi:MAG: very short patch repair endonuclease [Actinomycetes bacterium]